MPLVTLCISKSNNSLNATDKFIPRKVLFLVFLHFSYARRLLIKAVINVVLRNIFVNFFYNFSLGGSLAKLVTSFFASTKLINDRPS